MNASANIHRDIAIENPGDDFPQAVAIFGSHAVSDALLMQTAEESAAAADYDISPDAAATPWMDARLNPAYRHQLWITRGLVANLTDTQLWSFFWITTNPDNISPAQRRANLNQAYADMKLGRTDRLARA